MVSIIGGMCCSKGASKDIHLAFVSNAKWLTGLHDEELPRDTLPHLRPAIRRLRPCSPVVARTVISRMYKIGDPELSSKPVYPCHCHDLYNIVLYSNVGNIPDSTHQITEHLIG